MFNETPVKNNSAKIYLLELSDRKFLILQELDMFAEVSLPPSGHFQYSN